MGIARKLIWIAGLVVATMAFTTASASAQEEPIEILNADTSDPCNPCTVHGEGESLIRRPDGVEISRCHDEVTGVVYHNGTGEGEWTGSSEGGAGCNTTACSSPEDHDGPDAVGETGEGTGHILGEVCANNGNYCEGEISVVETAINEGEGSVHQRCPHPVLPYVEVEGVWVGEVEDMEDEAIEVVHLDP